MEGTRVLDLKIDGLGPATQIGRGGFADVYQAEQFHLRRMVAVKVLRFQPTDPDAQMRFERECRALGAVSGHPNIVAVHEGGFTADGRPYLVMELCPGGSLQDRLNMSGPLPPAEVADVGLKIAGALEVAHLNGVLHRDVKPGNILITAFDDYALTDFGIARIEGGQHTATGFVSASLIHCAPEVLKGEEPDPGTDVYSLGSTLFELAVGHAPHPPVDGESMMALVDRVVKTPVPDPATLGVPEPLASVIRTATASEPADRYPTAKGLSAALKAASSHNNRGAAVLPGMKPNRPAVMLAVVALVVAVGMIGAWLLGSPRPSLPVEVGLEVGATGPLEAGRVYEIRALGASNPARFRLLVDGEPVSNKPQAKPNPYLAQPGLHELSLEITDGSKVTVSEPVMVYGIGELPPPGFRANLEAFTARPENWSGVIERYQELVSHGHTSLLILPSETFSTTTGFWNLLVADFGDDRSKAADYCRRFNLAIPDQCFAAPFEPTG